MSASNVTRLPVDAAAPPRLDTPNGFDELPPVMSPKTLADVLEVTPKTLERWRIAATGPVWHNIPGSSLIRYTREDVVSWLASCRAAGEARTAS